ncbi:hypothetical protein [Halobacterium litoreum]|uniref:Uncharacterized protein n=1 Tax=Halobacterium litoreum TaxID=2039234 RepID=A0ABD5NBM9_9EURY|nr:hypothetical protein [Halobacterium litoreum]UHH14511.1 hypothetical protein LT972_05805 [Halobacterium litoreum]
MNEDSFNTDRPIKELGVRHVEGYFNLNSGRLEEVLIEVADTNPTEKVWWSVSYAVDLGEAKVGQFPEIRDPSKLAEVLTRSDLAVRKIDTIDTVVPWHEEFREQYRGMDLDDIEEQLPKFTKLEEESD